MKHCSDYTPSIKRRFLLLFVPALLCCAAVHARPVNDTITVHYNYGRSDIDLGLRDNRESIDTLFDRLNAVMRVPKAGKVAFSLDAYSSPEGSATANKRLSEKRVRLLLEYIRTRASIPDSIVTVRSHGIDWDGLDSLVSNSGMPYRNEVLDVLRNTPEWVFDKDRRIVDGRKRRLGMLRGGRPYNYMLANMFPLLRRSCITIIIHNEDDALHDGSAMQDVYTIQDIQPETATVLPGEVVLPATDTVATLPEETLLPATEETAAETPAVSVQRTGNVFCPVIAVKTNLLEWAGVMPDFRHYTFVPNLEVEWYFRDRWSLSGKGSYIKRGYGGNKFFAVSSWSIEPRLWMWGDGRFRWLYLGVYGQIGDYDVQNNRMDFTGATGRFWSSGLSLGAVIPFTDRLGLGIGLRGGYRHSTVRDYSHETGGDYLERTGTDKHWGITGINISLYWRFGKTVKKQRP